MFSELKSRFHRWQFERAVSEVLNTPPLTLARSGPVALSMVQHRDVLPYLLAIKSIARQLPPARVVVVADPSLDVQDRATIARHVPGVEFRPAQAARVEEVPTGGCWERLLSIAQLCSDQYVMQVDADLVAVANLDEVGAAIESNVSFTLGTVDDQIIVTTGEAARFWNGRLGSAPHVQALCESVLDRFDPQGTCRYVRGCAGFSGFSRGSINVEQVQDLSRRMRELVGPRWSEWGSEQFASNLLVASSPGSRVLPHPKYCAPHRRTEQTALLHFIGFVRYTSGLYAQTARGVIDHLRTA